MVVAGDSEQPDIGEDGPDGKEEKYPDLPTHTRLFGHPQHPPHGPSQPDPRIFKRVVDLRRQSARVSNLIANGDRQGLELRHLLGK